MITNTSTQQVVIVNGSPEMLATLDTVLDGDHYDVVFVESTEHAYSQIKRVQPDLVVICARLDDPDSFQVLSMLKLDDDTRFIPVLTCTTDPSEDEADEDDVEPSDVGLFQARRAAIWMN